MLVADMDQRVSMGDRVLEEIGSLFPFIREFSGKKWAPKRAGIAKRARELFDVRRVAGQYEALWGAHP
jgi:hypothetical protein